MLMLRTQASGCVRKAQAPRAVPHLAKRQVAARAASQEQSGFAKFANSIGLPTEDGVFGFTPFAENWCGRWAMMGFISSIVVEAVTGKGTLQQVGLPSPSGPLLAVMCVLFGGATIAATAATVQKAASKQMSRKEIDRYKSFLGLLKEKEDIRNAASMMKGGRGGPALSPSLDLDEITRVKAEGTAADAFLSTSDLKDAQQAAAEMKAKEAGQQAASTSAAREAVDTMYFGEQMEMAYARSVEISNGRWAMVGFLAGILVEAATGQGIVAQLITACKVSGLLGEKSGF